MEEELKKRLDEMGRYYRNILDSNHAIYEIVLGREKAFVQALGACLFRLKELGLTNSEASNILKGCEVQDGDLRLMHADLDRGISLMGWEGTVGVAPPDPDGPLSLAWFEDRIALAFKKLESKQETLQ